MADVLITEYTDPACPWAYSAEPFRQRLNWLYGDRLEWQARMVVLSESTAELEARGFGVKQLSGAYRAIARDHGMPIDTSERRRMAASRPACQAVVATRPSGRVRCCARCGCATSRASCSMPRRRSRAPRPTPASITSRSVTGWPATTCARRSRRTRPSRGRRCPPRACSTTSSRTGPEACGTRARATRSCARATACGSRSRAFSPSRSTTRSSPTWCRIWVAAVPPSGVDEVLEWAGGPLASKEVAVVAGLEVWEAREALGRVASERHVGADGFWSLA